MYDNICNFKSLLYSYKEAKKCKRFKRNIVDYGFFLENNLLKLQKELITEIYLPSPYLCFTVYETKVRKVAAPAFRDRVLQHCLVSQIEPLFERRFIYDSYACRKGKGTHLGMRRVKKFLQAARSKYGKDAPIYCLRMDVRKFFASVSWDVLLFCVNKTVVCEKTRRLIEKIITQYRFFNLKGEYINPTEDVMNINKRCGLPIGNLTSQLFANIYLNELDHFVKETLKVRWYARYMDDFLVIHPDKNYLKQLKDDIKLFLEYHLQLELSANKVVVQNTKSGIPFVGYLIFYDHVRVRGKTLIRMRRKLKSKTELFERKGDSRKFKAVRSSIKGHLKFANSYNLQKILFKDNLSAKQVKKKKIAYEQLKLFTFVFAVFSISCIS
ncbi:reverse transcriptase/maturase family protein [Patescibacteria group bacterium]|nr:reverse transcriptase/maturase family protein [Patescibacteria group bacterium]